MAGSQQDELNVPLLAEKHSGIPDYLLKAQQAKAQALAVTTKTQGPRQRNAVYPQGVEENVFDGALDELRGQLGAEFVELNDNPYMEHPNTHDMMYVIDQEELVPSAIVYPGSTEEVQHIVQWANKFRIPIFPISMGRNLGYGGAAPRVRGSYVIPSFGQKENKRKAPAMTVMDLGRRMNKIIDGVYQTISFPFLIRYCLEGSMLTYVIINPEDYTCLVEPGVSFFALYEAIKAKGYDHLWIDPPDVGGGSIIGNTVDRGVGYTAHHTEIIGHAIVVWKSCFRREKQFVLEWGLSQESNTWQTFPYGFGPYSDGIFSQSNFGIVTKMGVTLMPNPGGHESFMYTFQREEDLHELIEIIRPLRISNILENVAQLRHVVQSIAVIGEPRSTYYTGEGAIPLQVVHEAAANTPVGDHTWVYYGMSYGPSHIRQYKLSIIDAEFKKIAGARRIDASTLPPDEYFWARDRIAAGVPDVQELRWVNWVPNGAHVAFSPVSPIRGVDATRLIELARRRHDEFGIDLLPAFIVGLREMHLIVEIVFDRADPARREAALKCLRAMIDDAAACGYGEYRTHLVLMDQIANTYNWNDGALLRFHEKLKDALDPNGILAPGRCGIWPRQYRNRGWEMTRESGNRSQGQGVAAN
ncbi:vanillyl alcohol oxidase [Xylariaceae sp. FL1019]|nr:vanillyl alcohol oxidase [Xylariaceae sp. FL1019]